MTDILLSSNNTLSNYNHKHIKSHDSSTIIDILRRCRIILSGDLNINQNDFNLFDTYLESGSTLTMQNFGTGFPIPMKNSSNRINTCCDGSGSGRNHSLIYDHVLSSNTVPISVTYPQVINPASDHLPVISVVNPKPNSITPVTGKYSIYLVPWDFWDHFKGKVSNGAWKYWEEWGGRKPHCTLCSFAYHNIVNAQTVIENIAKGGQSKRWVIRNRNSNTFIKYTNLMIWSFYSQNIRTLQDEMKTAGFQNIKTGDLHFTLGYHIGITDSQGCKIIRNGIKNSKDFRLVIAADDNSGQINWTHSYFLYDR